MSYRDLADAIILQAVGDYRNALRGRGHSGMAARDCIEELERFFRSDYFEILTKVDGNRLITWLRKERANERRTNPKHTRSH
jgi:hypothetical protein